MKIIPAYPDLPGVDKPHKVDSPIEVDDALGSQLVRDGFARSDDTTTTTKKEQG